MDLIALTPDHLDELRRFIEGPDIGKHRIGKLKFRKDKGSFKISASADFSPLEETIQTGVNQVSVISKKVEDVRRKGVGKALKIYRDASGVTRSQLKEIERQNKQLKAELEDVKRELAECLVGGDDSKLTPKSKLVKVQSAISQVEDVAKEANEMEALIQETMEVNNAVEEAASKAVLDAAKESIDELDRAMDDIQDDVAIHLDLEATGEMPSEISAIPGAPPAPAFTKVVQYTTKDGNRVQGTPQQFASAQVTAEALKMKREELISETSEAIDAIQEERKSESSGGLGDALRKALEERRKRVGSKARVALDDKSKIRTKMVFSSLMNTLDEEDEEEEMPSIRTRMKKITPRPISIASENEEFDYW